MTRQNPDDVQKELDEQDDEFYGEGSLSGTAPDPEKIVNKDTSEHVEDVIGNDPDDEGEDGFNLGDEVNEDEEDIQDKPINDYSDEDSE